MVDPLFEPESASKKGQTPYIEDRKERESKSLSSPADSSFTLLILLEIDELDELQKILSAPRNCSTASNEVPQPDNAKPTKLIHDVKEINDILAKTSKYKYGTTLSLGARRRRGSG
jgi:hypothetical protein